MDLKSLQNQGNKKGSQGNTQPNGTKPRLCTNSLAQLAFNGPTKALDEYWRTCLREVSKEKKKEDQKGNPSFLEADWLELRQHIHQAYHSTEPEGPTQKNSRIDKIIKRLCTKDSQQLLLFLESQVQEFVIEVKVGLLELLSKNSPGVQLSRNFLTGLVDSYARLCAGAKRLAPPLKGVEEKHLSMFGMSWEDLNKLLFERCVHADPVMQLKVPQFIGHLHSSLPAKDKSSFYGIFQRILALEDEMTVIANKWKKVESFVHEKNLSSLNSMVEELRLDSCGQQSQGKGQARGKDQNARAAKEQCECRICTSPLLQQLSSLGLTSQNYKEVRERLRKMLDQKTQGLKSKVAAANVQTGASTSQTGKSTTNKTTSQQQQQQQQNSNTTAPGAGSQKNQGKQKANQQKTKASGGAATTATSVPNNAKQQASSTPAAPAVGTHGKQTPAQGNKPGSSKIPAPIPPYVKQVPPTPPPSAVQTSGSKHASAAPGKSSQQQQKAACPVPQNSKRATCRCGAHEAHAGRLAQIQSSTSSSPSPQPSTPERLDLRDIDALVDFIEGTDRVQISHMNAKKAAKKARQKQRKLEERQMRLEMCDDDYDDEDEEEEEEEEEEEYMPAPVVHVKQRGSPAPQMPAYQTVSQQAAAVNQARKGSPQMVTIRRVMEHNSAEPTVTITLKGDTPEKDTVLFTLVNGQVCKDEEKKTNKGKDQQSQQQNQKSTGGNAQIAETKSKKKKKKRVEASNNKQQAKPTSAPSAKPQVTVTPIPQQPSTAGTILEPVPYLPSGPTQHPRPLSSNSLLFASQGSTGLGAFYAPVTIQPSSNPAPPPPPPQYQQGNFTLDSIRLPPGITITKVETPQHQNMHGNPQSVQNRELAPEMRQYMPPAPTLPPGVTMANPRMGGMPGMPGPMGMGGSMGMTNPNVIVVDTGKLIEDSKNSNNQAKSTEVNRMGSNQRMQNGGSVPSGNYVTLKRIVSDDHGSSVSIIPSNCEVNANGDQSTTSKKKKNKKKNKGKKVDEWNLVESVFAPRNIDLDAVDDDERELEAFKRFCFNSVPPERKEKVHLNLKDLVIKKKP